MSTIQVTMKTQIYENLNSALVSPVTRERVVYIMVELRKLIDHLRSESTSTPSSWMNVKYWCDWIVHTELDRTFAREVLTKMEEHIVNNPSEKFHWNDFNSSFVSIEDFRHDLWRFLEQQGLPSEITNIPPWDEFTRYLVETLRDCPLKKQQGVLREFAFVKKPHIPEAEKYSIDYELRFDGSRSNIEGKVLRFEKKKPKKRTPASRLRYK